MAIRRAEAEWQGRLASGQGTMALGSGAFEGRYSCGSRFGKEKGTNPEELIAAAHAGCFSMALAYGLEQGGFTARSIRTTARVHIEKSGAGLLSRGSSSIPSPRCRGSIRLGSSRRPKPQSGTARCRRPSPGRRSP
jgi:OsmC subfamily peroxiredoxin